MVGPNVVAIVAVGVALAGVGSSNFVMRGLSTLVVGVAIVLGATAWVGNRIAVEVTRPSVLHGMVPPIPEDPDLGRLQPGEGRIADLDQ